MNCSEKYNFAVKFFKENHIEYVVFDEYEKFLSARVTDIDILLKDEFDLKNFIKFLVDNDCTIINLILNDYSYQIYFRVDTDGTIIHIDILPGLILRGINIDPNNLSLKNKIFKDDIYFADAKSIYYYELLRSLTISSIINKKYFNKIQDIYNNSYQERIINSYGDKFDKSLISLIENKNIKMNNINFNLHFILYSIKMDFKNITLFMKHYYTLILRYIKYPGLHIVHSNNIVDRTILDELLTDIVYIKEPKNIFEKIINSIKILKYRGETKLVISKKSGYSFCKEDIDFDNKIFSEEKVIDFMVNRLKKRYKIYCE